MGDPYRLERETNCGTVTLQDYTHPEREDVVSRLFVEGSYLEITTDLAEEIIDVLSSTLEKRFDCPHSFSPNWASPPGDTIKDALKELGKSPEWLQEYLEVPVGDLLSGEVQITGKIAQILHERLGASVSFWCNRERQYRKTLEEIKKNA